MSFAATMTEAEKAVWARHRDRIQQLFAQGAILVVGPALGTVNTEICICEAADEVAARELMNDYPAIAEGFARGGCVR